jgi:hypothetical protein
MPLRVRYGWLDENKTETCSLESFLDANPDLLTKKELNRLLGGDVIIYGGGAAPAGSVELVGYAERRRGGTTSINAQRPVRKRKRAK